VNLRQLAIRNFWRNRDRYLAYLASASLSVMIFFLYMSLAKHPQFQKGYFGAHYAMQGMKAAAAVVAIFTFLFLLYSNSAFIRSRKKEFGLLSLLGFARAQLVRLVIWESLTVCALALAIGIAGGLLFQRLFFMAISALLQMPESIPFYAGPDVLLITTTVFGSFFLLVSLASLRHVIRSDVVSLLRAGRQPKAAPTFSRLRALLGSLLVGGGYWWASSPEPNLVVLGVIPVTIMVSIGTGLLIREGSVALLHWLRARKGFFYRRGPFLGVSQLIFKIQDNSRVLTAVALLIAVIVTAVGTALAFYVVMAEHVQGTVPWSFQLMAKPATELSSELVRVAPVLERHGFSGSEEMRLITRQAFLGGPTGGRQQGLLVAPYSFYLRARELGGTLRPLPSENGALIVPGHLAMYSHDYPVQPQLLQVDTRQYHLEVQEDPSGALLDPFGSHFAEVGNRVLIVSDDLFATIMSDTAAADLVAIALWDEDHDRTRAAAAVAQELTASVAERQGEGALGVKAEAYNGMVSSLGLVLFVGVFVSLVFFAACCSLLYFRLFTEIEDDRRYYRRLRDQGLGAIELSRVALEQSAAVFFVPFLVGLVHATFAMRALGTLLGRPVLVCGWVVGLCYLVLYALFFVIMQSFYWQNLHLSGTGTNAG
jgi:putative ABC transport system permease protein